MAIVSHRRASSFASILAYADKADAEYLGGNMAGRNISQLALEFSPIRHQRTDVESPVFHASISVSPDEEVSDRKWRALAREYLKEMGFKDCQYCLFKHNDKDHPHIHIVANRINPFDRQLVSDSFDYYKSFKVMRKLEKEFGLKENRSHYRQPVKPLTTGEIRAQRRTGKQPIRLDLQNALDRCIPSSKSLDELAENLQQYNISTRFRQNRNGQVNGISFSKNGIAFSGSKLGYNYTLNSIRNSLDKEFICIEDKKLTEVKPMTVNRDTNQPETPIQPIAQLAILENIKTLETEKKMRQLAQSQTKNDRALYLKLQKQIIDGQRDRQNTLPQHILDTAIAMTMINNGASYIQAGQVLAQSDEALKSASDELAKNYVAGVLITVKEGIERDRSEQERDRAEKERG